jgi:hypothetical protein
MTFKPNSSVALPDLPALLECTDQNIAAAGSLATANNSCILLLLCRHAELHVTYIYQLK